MHGHPSLATLGGEDDHLVSERRAPPTAMLTSASFNPDLNDGCPALRDLGRESRAQPELTAFLHSQLACATQVIVDTPARISPDMGVTVRHIPRFGG
jgi:hypothetical protein